MPKHLRQPVSGHFASDLIPSVQTHIPAESEVEEREVTPVASAIESIESEPVGTQPLGIERVGIEPLEVAESDAADDDQGEKEEPRTTGLGLLKETGIIVLSALIVSWLIKTFLVQAFFIPSESMEDTFERGDRVMVSRLVPRFFEVHRGDIVVFKDPGEWLSAYQQPDRGPFANAMVTVFTGVGLLPQDSGEHLVKRAIGVGGDHVECCNIDGEVTVNGVPISESLYLRPGALPSQIPFDVTVPPHMLFVMGDNRQNSADSRFNSDKPFDGFVPMENVVGTAFATVWPLNRAQILHNPSSVFANVP